MNQYLIKFFFFLNQFTDTQHPIKTLENNTGWLREGSLFKCYTKYLKSYCLTTIKNKLRENNLVLCL